MKKEIVEYGKLLYRYLKYRKLNVLLLAFFLLANVGLQLINPQIVRYYIDTANGGTLPENLLMIATAFIGIAILQQLFSLMATYIGENLAWKATNDIRMDLTDHCMDLDMTFHKKYQQGELIERVDGDVSGLFDLFSNVFLTIINNVLLLIGVLLFLLNEDWRIALCLSLFSVFAIYLLTYVKRKTQDHWVKASEANAAFYGLIGEQISSTEDIASNNAKDYMMKLFYKMGRKIYPIIRKAELTWASMWTATLIIFVTGNVIAFSVSGYLWSNGIITVGTVYLIFHYTELLRRPIELIKVNLQDLQLSTASIVRIKELFDTKSSQVNGIKENVLSNAIEVEFKHVNFGYEKDSLVLKDLSFHLKQGRTLGVLGRTGSGKTTLARLVVRMYDNDHGQIYLDQHNITDLSFKELNHHLAYITQNVQLFTATLRENITVFNHEINDEKIMEIIQKLQLVEWYEGFSNGLDTFIQANGGTLSAGEEQLLAFIRVFIKNPGLIILDEATSKIDPVTEHYIERALNKLLENRTSIIIAHRLRTLDRADDLLILEKGKVLEAGEKGELLTNHSSHFNHLVKQGIEEALIQ
ncbi:ABC transporter ATP-binding protein [Bacillus spongiae]|uniref:ABC transporter ATP-binding protein n=1 Tax=Bacillus spongiae TaxID=2683610 RepID=A0ABU8HCQ2_9BACI